MDNLTRRLFDEIRRIPLVDPHTHIDPLAPASRSLDDLLGYHYYTELAHSAGMDGSLADPQTPARARRHGLAEFLPAIENTAQYSWLLQIARDLLGFDHDRIDRENIDELAELADRHMGGPSWADRVLAESNIRAVFLTNDFDDPLAGFDTARYVPCLRADDLVFNWQADSVTARLARATNVEVSDPASLKKALGVIFERFAGSGARACAIGLPPYFRGAPGGRRALSRSADRLAGDVETGPDDMPPASRMALRAVAELCDDFGLPLDLMIGAVRGLYPAGVAGGRDLFDRRCSLAQFAFLFKAFPNVRFPVSIIDSAGNPELVAFGWIFPNVYPAGHWWYANSPPLIERDLRQRLAAVPRAKLLGYYSDAYKLEFCLPKFDMYRRALARVLAEDFVIARGWPEEKAVALAGDLLAGNIDHIFPPPAKGPR